MLIGTVAGNVGGDAELKRPADTDVLEWSVAHSRGRDDQPTWVRCSLWGARAAKLQPHIRRGDKITCTGDLRIWEGSLQMRVYEVELGGRREGGPF